MTPQIRCVVLDIDDTLYLERDYAASGFHAVGEHLQAAAFASSAVAALERGVRGRIFNEVLADLGLDPGPGGISELVRVYREHTPTIELLRDARERIESWNLRAALAVITDGPLASQQAKAQALGLGKWCRPILFTSALGPDCGKPHPAAYREVEEQLNMRPEECVYIADNPHKDFVTPRQRGWLSVRVRRPRSLHEAMVSGDDVDWEVENLDDLPAELEALLP